jgi:aryl-alcohol dehydrogenase-like predicted oxidoreductase
VVQYIQGWGRAERRPTDGIGFTPWFPLATGDLAQAGGPLLPPSPVMLPVPGTSRVTHLEENTAAARLELDDEVMRELDVQTV